MSTRHLDFSQIAQTRLPVLIAVIRRLVIAVQRSANVQRYPHLPADAVWWLRVVSKDGRYGNTFFDNIAKASLARTQYDRVEALLNSFGNMEDADIYAADYTTKMRTRLFLLYVRLAVLYIQQQGGYRDAYNTRIDLIETVYAAREAFVDFERVVPRNDLRQSLIRFVLTHYLLYSQDKPTSAGWTYGLQFVEKHLRYMEKWRSTSLLTKLAEYMSKRTQSDAFARMSAGAFDVSLRRAYPAGEDMIADVLSYLLAVSPMMQKEFGNRAYTLASLFRQKLRTIASSSQALLDYFSNVNNLRELLNTWSSHARFDEMEYLGYVAQALVVVREIAKHDGTIYACYAHISEHRHLQFNLKSQRAFDFPPPVDVSDPSTLVTFRFKGEKQCKIQASELDKLPFIINTQHVLGAGRNGVVYRTSNLNIVVKLTDRFSQQEFDVAKRAGELGFAPKTYGLYQIPNALIVHKNIGVFGNVSLIASERMYATMEQMLSAQTTAEKWITIVDAVVEMAEDFGIAHFAHHDLKPDNIMLAGKEANPAMKTSWRFIDFGTSWYGGDEFSPSRLRRNERCEPYGWNHRTNTLEDPRKVYPSWMRTVPPARIRNWDVFCLLYYLYRYTVQKTTHPDYVEDVYDLLLQRINVLVEGDRHFYAITNESGRITGVRVHVTADMIAYHSLYPLVGGDRDSVWRERNNYKELSHQLPDGLLRIFIPFQLLDRYRVTLIDYMGTDLKRDLAYTCTAGEESNAMVRFMDDEDGVAEHDTMLLRIANTLGVGPRVAGVDTRLVTRFLDYDTRIVAGVDMRTVVLLGTGKTLHMMLDELIGSVVTEYVRARIEEVLTVAFRSVQALADLGFIHHSLTPESLLYDSDSKTFFLSNFSDVWYAGSDRSIPYGRMANGTVREFKTSNGLVLGRAQFSLSAVLLFTNVYHEFIMKRLRDADRRIEAEVATFMRRTIYHRHLLPYRNECVRLLMPDDDHAFVVYKYLDASGEEQTVNI